MTRSFMYTRTGDRGETSLGDGRRVVKHDPRVEAYGSLDEANSWVGVAVAFTDQGHLKEILQFVQHRLYNCSSNVATPTDEGLRRTPISKEDITFLEGAIDYLDAQVGALSYFVLPGGGKLGSFLHVARTICRRAERCLTTLAAREPVDPHVLQFVNRVSDLLFVCARYANSLSGEGDVAWDKGFVPPENLVK